MQTIELCQRCGYDLPDGATTCPGCQDRGHTRPPGRAARQVAGIDLPTRSVHALPTMTPRRERHAARLRRRPSWAADLFAFTTLLALATVAARLVAVVAHTDRFTAQLAASSLARIDGTVTILAWACAAAAGLTLAALTSQAVRALGRVHRPSAHLPR